MSFVFTDPRVVVTNKDGERVAIGRVTSFTIEPEREPALALASKSQLEFQVEMDRLDHLAADYLFVPRCPSCQCDSMVYDSLCRWWCCRFDHATVNLEDVYALLRRRWWRLIAAWRGWV